MAESLREALLSAALSTEVSATDSEQYGKRYVLDFEMKIEVGTAIVRSAWIVCREEEFPRLASCWVI